MNKCNEVTMTHACSAKGLYIGNFSSLQTLQGCCRQLVRLTKKVNDKNFSLVNKLNFIFTINTNKI